MNEYIQIRVSRDLKKSFREAAEKNNPGIPKNQVMSATLRSLMTEYVERNKNLGGNKMIDYGKWCIKGVNKKRYQDTFYVTVVDSRIVVDKNRPMPCMESGKITVLHDGIYFGDDMEEWLKEQVVDYFIDNGYLVEDGETVMGETCWKLQA